MAEAEQQEAGLRRELERVETEVQQRPLQVHSGRVKQYLEDLHSTLEKGGLRARQLLQGHIERTQFWTLLDRVVIVVAGARFEVVDATAEVRADSGVICPFRLMMVIRPLLAGTRCAEVRVPYGWR